MNLALLHYSFFPESGGVENVMRDQANLLRRAGHTVKIITGAGSEMVDGHPVQVMPELAPDFALNVAVRTVLERGQADLNFNKYRAVLVEALTKALEGTEIALVHNVFTMHFNLVFTCALHDLAARYEMVAWTHDLTATNSDYALPNPTKQPWSFVRMSFPKVTYVTVSERRAEEMKANLQPVPEPLVIPDVVDMARVFGFTPEIRDSMAPLELAERDFIFLLPARVMLRKNIDFALEAMKVLCELGHNPLLLITGANVSNSDASVRYGEFLRQSLPKILLHQVVFVSDFFPIHEDTMRDLYLIADCLLFPSKQEGFGLPIIEAGLHRLPIWCSQVPAYQSIQGEGAFLLDNLAKVPEALAWLEAQPTFRNQRQCRREFDPEFLYHQHYEPLFAQLIPPVPL